MSRFDLLTLRNVFADQGVMICFNGPFSHSVIEELGTAVRKYLQSNDAPKDRIADVFSVFVEQAQNLKNYTSSDFSTIPNGADFKHGTLVIARDRDHYIVSSGNLIRSEDCRRLIEKLDFLADQGPDELRALYKQRLRSGIDAGSAAEPRLTGGAGLGLIEMARKASRPIVYSEQPADGEAHYFSISVFI